MVGWWVVQRFPDSAVAVHVLVYGQRSSRTHHELPFRHLNCEGGPAVGVPPNGYKEGQWTLVLNFEKLISSGLSSFSGPAPVPSRIVQACDP